MRDFIYVGYIVDANISAMNHLSNLEAKTINIGSGSNITIKEMASSISDKKVHIEARPGEAENTLADITIAKDILNFYPKVNIKEWIMNNK